MLLLSATLANAYNVSIVNYAGNVTYLGYDVPSASYIDANTNPNIFVRACGIATNGKYAALAYEGGNATLVISQQAGPLGNAIRIPATATDCVDIDLDVSSFLAAYPGQPELVISNDSFVSQDDDFYAIGSDNGTLVGYYTATGTADSENLTISIGRIGTTLACSPPNEISLSNKQLIVACAHDAAGASSCVLASPASTITIPLNGLNYSYFTLNNKAPIDCAAPPACPSGTIMCSDGSCSTSCGGGGTTDNNIYSQASANCTNETAVVTFKNGLNALFSPSTVNVTLGGAQQALQLVSAGTYTLTPQTAGTYDVSATSPGFIPYSGSFKVDNCAVPPACKENDVSCSLDYNCCSGFCNSFGVCANA
ncbi:MAG TPA: hypothetical protein PLO51_01290, partial [Candidatus Micrarchaeota archaeon]|nr:hypothetical protein [Candidatus Micrarchaeota archaeon]